MESADKITIKKTTIGKVLYLGFFASNECIKINPIIAFLAASAKIGLTKKF